MENVMNFLADNYIWFFVAAGILCFALIGFIIESRKKQKNEFKGESIEESKTIDNSVNNVSASNVTETPVNTILDNTNVDPFNSINSNSVVNTETNTSPVIEETMEINDIPLNMANQTEEKKSGIEFYNGPIEMPINAPIPEPSPEPVVDINTTQVVSNNETVSPVEPVGPVVSATIGDTISYERITPVENNNTLNNIPDNTNLDNKPVENNDTNNFNMFDNMN